MNRPEEELPIDLESSSQIELDRVPACDADSLPADSPGVPDVPEPPHARRSNSNRELLSNPFPAEL